MTTPTPSAGNPEELPAAITQQIAGLLTCFMFAVAKTHPDPAALFDAFANYWNDAQQAASKNPHVPHEVHIAQENARGIADAVFELLRARH